MKEETETKETLICDDCGCKSESVEETTCPYQEDINGISVEVTLCNACYHERCMDI